MAEDLSGKQFGDLKIIGDTGKRNKNGMQIVIARDSEGNIHEYLASNIKNGFATGFKKSELNKINGREWANKTHQKTMRNGYNVSLLRNNAPRKNNDTEYKYVRFNNELKRWIVEFRFDDIHITQNFIYFDDAVKLSNELKDKYLYPILNEEEKEVYLNSYKHEIVVNDYVKEKQREIFQSIKNGKIKRIKKTIERYKNSKGVTYDKSKNRWAARIKIQSKTKHLGYFENEQDAKEARQKAVNKQIKKLEKEMERI